MSSEQIINTLIWLGFAAIGAKALEVIISAVSRARQLRRKTQETLIAWTDSQSRLYKAQEDVRDGRIRDRLEFTRRIRSHAERHLDRFSPHAIFLNIIWLVATDSSFTSRELLEHYRSSEDRHWFHRQNWKAVAAQAGLLGTIYGVIGAFSQLANGQKPLETLGAISIALYTTLAGLLMALPLHAVLYQVFKPRLDEFEAVTDVAYLDLKLGTLELVVQLERVEQQQRPRQTTRTNGSPRVGRPSRRFTP